MQPPHSPPGRNEAFLRECPGRELHKIQPTRGRDSYSGNENERMDAALEDFAQIFMRRPSVMVLHMLSAFARCYIEREAIRNAEKTEDVAQRKKLVDEAFEKFEGLSNCLNHVFEQFAVLCLDRTPP